MPPKKIKFKVVKKLPAKEKPVEKTLEEFLKTAKLTTTERQNMLKKLAKEKKGTFDGSSFYPNRMEEKKARKKVLTQRFKRKFKVKKPAPSLGKRQTGLTKEQMNKLSPLELFSKLPTELKGKVAKSGSLGKRKATSYKYDEIVEPEDDNDNLLYIAEENAQSSLGHLGIGWIKGITDSMNRFYKENSYRAYELSPKKMARLEKIEEKVNDGLRPSLEKELKREFKKWKDKNKDESFTLKEAQKSFESFYF